MADQFVSKRRVSPDDFIEVGGQTALARFAALNAVLTERSGPEVAGLFAEPMVSHGNDTAPPTVSWYTDLTGEHVPLSQLAPGEKARVEQYLADHLRPVQALAADPQHADLANAALTGFGEEDVMVIGDRPVIVDWGLMPGAKSASPAARAAHQAATLGRFLPRAAAPPPQAAASAATPPVNAPVAPATMSANVPLSRIAWVPLVVLLLLAGVTLIWLLLPGTRIFAEDDAQPAITDQAELDAAIAHNAALRDRKAQLQAALAGAQCRPDGTLVLPSGLTPEGLTPPPVGTAPEDKAQAAPDALLPSSPARVVAPDGQGSLLDTLRARTVLVLVRSDADTGLGSGFVIGPGLIATNQHVIEAAQGPGGAVFVTNDALGEPVRAEILKSRGPLKETGQDFALLRIADTRLPAFPLYTGDAALTLSNVVAAGFPGDVLEFDVDFAALRAGNREAVPAITVTDGIVNTEQKIGPSTNVLMHSAALSRGNSGGPLVDMCGRVVGVNSFVRRGPMQNRGYALTTGDLLQFLGGTGVDPETVQEPCVPVVARPQTAAAPDQPAEEN
jgi:S1-C subfamily serine protease